MNAQSLSHVRLFATSWTVAHQAPLSMEFFRQEYWSGLPFLTPGDLPDPGTKPLSLMSSALDSLPLRHLGSPFFFFFLGSPFLFEPLFSILCGRTGINGTLADSRLP